MSFNRVLLGASLFLLPNFILSASAKGAKTAILVDKHTNTLSITELVDGEYKILKTYHATLGKVKGDKEREADLKTPEGIYTFKARLTPPTLKKKFGAMAFYVNYPNAYDEIAGRTGFDIMLHATDTPDRLKQDYDSEGCVVVKNEEIAELQPQIRVGLTPILIFPKLTDDFKKPGKDPAILSFFQSWIRAWEGKSLDAYIDHYHSEFKAQGKDRDQWRSYKGALNSRYTDIKINPSDILYYRHPKYWMVTFSQNYRSKLKGGGWGHRSTGTKILYIAEEAGKPKIIAETFTNAMW
jgi:murein L,D-transpeptidase YafK